MKLTCKNAILKILKDVILENSSHAGQNDLISSWYVFVGQSCYVTTYEKIKSSGIHKNSTLNQKLKLSLILHFWTVYAKEYFKRRLFSNPFTGSELTAIAPVLLPVDLPADPVRICIFWPDGYSHFHLSDKRVTKFRNKTVFVSGLKSVFDECHDWDTISINKDLFTEFTIRTIVNEVIVLTAIKYQIRSDLKG